MERSLEIGLCCSWYLIQDLRASEGRSQNDRQQKKALFRHISTSFLGRRNSRVAPFPVDGEKMMHEGSVVGR